MKRYMYYSFVILKLYSNEQFQAKLSNCFSSVRNIEKNIHLHDMWSDGISSRYSVMYILSGSVIYTLFVRKYTVGII